MSLIQPPLVPPNLAHVHVADLPKNAVILSIAASAALCSLTLRTALGDLVWNSSDNNQHSEQILPAIAALLAQAKLAKPDVIAVDIGPGAFTSVRVACGAAQGLALGWGCPVIAVQSLSALAQQAVMLQPTATQITCVIDARMGECYVAYYAAQAGHVTQTSPPHLLAYDAVQPNTSDTVIGNAASVLPQWHSLAAQVIDAAPSAQGVLAQALSDIQHGTVDYLLPEQVQPLYVRNQVAFTAAQRSAGLDKV